DQLNSWGWRIPFIAGSLLGILGYFLRRGLIETPLFTAVLDKSDVARIPVIELFRSHGRAVFIGIGLTSSAAAMVSLYMLLPPYASRHLDFPVEDVFVFTTTALLLLSLLTLFCGWLSDQVGRKRLLIIGGTILLMVAHPASEAMKTGSLWTMLLLTLIPAAIANGCYVSSVSELFSTPVRYTGLAVCINLGVCVFGGCVPYIIELLNQSGYNSGPLLLMLVTGLITVVSSSVMVSRHRRSLDSSQQPSADIKLAG
nr:MFS transporter [Endozoicomonas sp.]